MKITIESSEILTTYNGGRVRAWKGVTESGVRCVVYIAGVQVDRDDDCAQFERELLETGIPRELKPLAEVFDLRMLTT